MAQTEEWLDAVRSSHARLAALLETLPADQVTAPAYPSDWSIADTASHLGSGAEIFGLLLQAGLDGADAPGRDVYLGVWDRWNALAPDEQVRQSVAANAALVETLDGLDASARETLAVPAFGTTLDLAGLLAARLSEHAVHAWDIAVALDPTATVADDAVALLVDRLPTTAGRSGTAAADGPDVVLTTTEPVRTFHLQVGQDAVVLDPVEEAPDDALTLPAEALLRLVYGRLDPGHTPAGVDPRVDELRPVFGGF